MEARSTQSLKIMKTQRGFIKKDPKHTISQQQIAKSVDITNATKHFELNLDKLGPYKLRYYKNGRYLVLGGERGHLAAFDWLTKDLLCEFNVRESVHDVIWLHMPTMFAAAQKEWVHIYDKDGIELNVIKTMYRATHLDFLQYHFLLAAASDKGYLTWKDISIGKDIASFPTKQKVTSLTHNPYNGLLVCSHPNGTVSMWSPNHNRPAISMLCSPAPVRSVSVTIEGNYFATSAVDRTIKVWDLRNNYKCLKEHRISYVPDVSSFSQLGMLAVAGGSTVTVYKDVCHTEKPISPYLRHNVQNVIQDLSFCNYEDVLGVGHRRGFTSLLTPGSGEPNFDSLEANPFMSKAQQREMEVKMLLDKISPQMICLEPSELATTRKVDK
jgi:U3 small nucleolar RNA-associated protein 7